MTAVPTGTMTTGPDAVGVAGTNGFTSRGFLMGTNYTKPPAPKILTGVNSPQYPQRATPANPGSVKLALGKLPSIFALYHG